MYFLLVMFMASVACVSGAEQNNRLANISWLPGGIDSLKKEPKDQTKQWKEEIEKRYKDEEGRIDARIKELELETDSLTDAMDEIRHMIHEYRRKMTEKNKEATEIVITIKEEVIATYKDQANHMDRIIKDLKYIRANVEANKIKELELMEKQNLSTVDKIRDHLSTLIFAIKEMNIGKLQLYLEVLGYPKDTVLNNVNKKDVTNRYHDLAVVFHPDKAKEHKIAPEKAKEIFQAINEAYAFIKDYV